MTKKVRLIYNPVSGREQMLQNIVDILNILEQAGFEANAFRITPEPLSTQNETKRCALVGSDSIIGAGEDGMISEVADGVVPLKKRPRLAVIPTETTNDFARTLKTPRDNLVDTAKVVLAGKTRKIDIGRTGKQYFMNIAASGSLIKLTYGVSLEVKSVLGYSTYLLKGAEMLPKISSNKVRLTYDDSVYGGDLSILLLGMTNSIGGFERIMPDAQLSDGLSQLIVVKTANPVNALRLMAMALSGNRVNDPQVIYTRTKYLKVELLGDSKDKGPIPVNLGGEIGGHLPIDFENLKQHIKFYIG